MHIYMLVQLHPTPISMSCYLGEKQPGVGDAARMTPYTVPATISGTAAKLCKPKRCCSMAQSSNSAADLQHRSTAAALKY